MTTPTHTPTTPLFNCPQCRAPVRAGDTRCHACGINLALAAVLSERRTLAAMPAGGPRPAAGLPRFGEFLVSQGYVSADELQAGLTRQRGAVALGIQRTIGQTLLEMGCLTREALELASIQQVKQLQSALEESNRQLEQRVVDHTQALQEALRRLTELEAMKSAFIANISHELRTPLAPIRGFGDLLAAGRLGDLTTGQADAVDAINRSAKRLEILIAQLIQFAASSRGDMVLHRGRTSLPDLALALWDYFEPRATASDIVLRQDWPDDLPPARADAEKIHWVLFQLIDNAIKYTPGGGQVTLAAEANGSCLHIEVRDTGAGIAPERLEHIFEPFSQPTDGPAALPDGAGLGLALARRIVEAHGSKLSVESQLDHGSCFAFDLTLAAPE